MMNRAKKAAFTVLTALLLADGSLAQAPGPAAAPPDAAPTILLPRGYRILVRDRKTQLDQIEKLIKEHDKSPREVRIESYVLQISVDKLDNTGIDLDFFFGGTKEDLPLGEFSTAGAMRGAGANQQFRFGSLSTERFQLFLDFLKRNTETKVLSKPMLTVLDGQLATINVGRQIPFVITTVTPGVGGAAGLQGTNVQFANIGINLTFTPTILPNDIVRMAIAPEISDVDGPAQANAPPPTRTNRVSTIMFVKNRHAFLIGGLYRLDAIERKARLPLLGNLPVIGDYFGENSRNRSRNEIVIVVKPTITSVEDFDTPIAPAPKKS